MVSRPPSGGVVLALVGGILAILLLLCASFLAILRAGAAYPAARLEAACASLAAESGMEYAAARLSWGGYLYDPSNPESRGDSWTFRDGARAPLERALNVSYAHGDAWDDATLDGVYDPAAPSADTFDPALHDRDGDGRFSSWSGRLRGSGARDPRFSLKISSLQGKLPVNAGYLDAARCKSLTVPYHRGLAQALDNLGAQILPGPPSSPLHPRRANLPGFNPGSHVFQLCWLGHDLISRRPAGGYRDWSHVVQELSALGVGYTQDDFDALEPFVDTGPYETLGEGSRAVPTDVDDPPPYIPVDLAAASREVLKSLFMYLDVVMDPGSVPGDATLRERISSRTGYIFQRNEELNYVLIYPDALDAYDEPGLLADRAMALCRNGAPSWRELRRIFVQEANVICKRDIEDLGGLSEFSRNWTQAKANAAFEAICVDPHLSDTRGGGSPTWTTWSIDADTATGEIEPPLSFPYGCFGSIPLPATPADTWPDDPFIYAESMLPQGGTLAVPTSFRVESLGALLAGGPAGGRGGVARAEGILRAAQRLHFTCQEDFENLAGAPMLAKRGITTLPETRGDLEKRHGWDPTPDWPDGATPAYANGTRREHAHVVSLPRANRRGLADAAGAIALPLYGFSRTYGALTLATREAGLLGAGLYWPFKEDFDGLFNNGGVTPPFWTGGPYGDLWHEQSPALPTSPPPTPMSQVFWEYVADASSYAITPLLGCRMPATSISGPYEYPGLNGPPGSVVRACSIECWFDCWSSLRIFTWNGNDDQINLSTSTEAAGGARTQVRALVRWANDDGSYFDNMEFPSDVELTMLIPHDLARPDRGWAHHVVLTLEGKDTNADGVTDATEIRLFVNGSDIDPDTGAQQKRMRTEEMRCANVSKDAGMSALDELRVYDGVLSDDPGPNPAPGSVQYNFNRERFVRAGTFKSPLYRFDAPTQLGKVQWTGFTPPVPGHTLNVDVAGYKNLAGNDPAWTPEDRTLAPSGEIDDLSGLPSIRSFRYKVRFDSNAVALGSMTDTPVFESIWMTFRRQGTSPWLGWSR